ncbi:MAG: hypothetical protein H0W08_26735 [Acidobacteria bacterium]|nr:hypothetical protein [Acidobacteriota bacterium]
MSAASTRIIVILTLIAFGGGCRKGAGDDTGKTSSPSPTKEAAATYAAPRWPSYFKPPTSVEALMEPARALVRNKSGFLGVGMGVLQAGETVLIVPNVTSDPMVVEAVVRALAERKVKADVRYTYELLGQTRDEAERLEAKEHQGRRIADAGIYQASTWITGQFPDPDAPKKWLKERRPDVYAELFPAEASGGEPAASTGAAGEPLSFAREMALVGAAIQEYLKKNPKMRGAFWGTAGGTGLRRAMYPMQDKFLGTFTTDNIWTLQSQMPNYPGDVWQLAEEQMLEPLVYAERLEVTDPEGTNLWSDLTPDMAERWSQGAYQRGHLYMFPNQATGRFGYSFVNYPGFQQKWLPREPIALVNGVIAGTQGHGGFYPRWEVTFKDGFIADVTGGGAQGAALKEFLKYPGLDRVYPYHTTPGFWYLYEIAIGTHPKAFRAPQPIMESGDTLPERARSGVVHWGLGIRLWHDPDAPTESKVWADFTKKHNVPFDHGWHTHTYFTTYKLRLRNANKWVTLLDKGRMTSLDDPEVRALASRYGDPDYLLAEDWVPEVPGINAPGDYLKDYAAKPGDYALKVIDKAGKGTYEHYFPQSKQGTAPAARALGAKGGRE